MNKYVFNLSTTNIYRNVEVTAEDRDDALAILFDRLDNQELAVDDENLDLEDVSVTPLNILPNGYTPMSLTQEQQDEDSDDDCGYVSLQQLRDSQQSVHQQSNTIANGTASAYVPLTSLQQQAATEDPLLQMNVNLLNLIEQMGQRIEQLNDKVQARENVLNDLLSVLNNRR